MASKCFEYFDFSFDFTLLNWLQHLDDYIFIVTNIDSGVYFRVFSLSNFGYDLKSVNISGL